MLPPSSGWSLKTRIQTCIRESVFRSRYIGWERFCLWILVSPPLFCANTISSHLIKNIIHANVIRLLIPWSTVFEKLIVAQIVKELLAFCGARRLITLLARAYHWSLSWASWMQSTLNTMYKINFNIILPCMPKSYMWPLPFKFSY